MTRTLGALAACCVLALVPARALPQGEGAPPPAQGDGAAPSKSAEQLGDLVAPIALYADPLVAQVLAAATYPLEVVEASRFVHDNPRLTGGDLVDAARQQPWDPSVQALVAFPSVLDFMDQNLSWTQDLGNAFLEQQEDVMDAIQRRRHQAYDQGRLASNDLERVERSSENDDDVIDIEPTDPDVIYVPVYDPVVVWGAPIYHPWPAFWYPPRPVRVFGVGPYGFFVGFNMNGLFQGGAWGGWRGWGWGCNWRGRSLVVNSNFYIHYNYRPPQNVLRNGPAPWVHDPSHREGVAYPSARVATRFGVPPSHPSPPEARAVARPPAVVAARPPAQRTGGALAGTESSGSRARIESDRGHASLQSRGSSNSSSHSSSHSSSSGGRPRK